MTRNPMRMIAAFGAMAVLAGCNLPPGPHAPDFGDAVRHNMEVHVVDPTAGQRPVDVSETDGARAVRAQSRYRTDTVKPPRDLRLPGLGG